MRTKNRIARITGRHNITLMPLGVSETTKVPDFGVIMFGKEENSIEMPLHDFIALIKASCKMRFPKTLWRDVKIEINKEGVWLLSPVKDGKAG